MSQQVHSYSFQIVYEDLKLDVVSNFGLSRKYSHGWSHLGSYRGRDEVNFVVSKLNHGDVRAFIATYFCWKMAQAFSNPFELRSVVRSK
eukprot:1181024-Prorocentrum_minimum.AAC.4